MDPTEQVKRAMTKRDHVGRGRMTPRDRGEFFECPVCHMKSHHPNDIKEGYCGACHDFTGERQ